MTAAADTAADAASLANYPIDIERAEDVIADSTSRGAVATTSDASTAEETA